MASIVIAGDTSGAVTIAAPATAGTPTLTLPTTSGTLVVTGGAQTIEFAAGSAAAPSITFTGDTNTGIFSPAADTIAFSEGGVESMRIDSSGNLLVGAASGFVGGTRSHFQSTSGQITTDFYRVNTIASNSTIARFVASDGGGTVVASVSTGGIVSAYGISFPASQVASSDANTLDDYEEGTWTPTLTEATYTYSNRVGSYVKIGSLVYANCFLTFSSFSAATGSTVDMTNLPFPAADGLATYALQAATIDNLTADLQQVGFQVVPGTTRGTMIGGIGKTGGHFGIPANALTVNTTVRVNYIYRTNF